MTLAQGSDQIFDVSRALSLWEESLTLFWEHLYLTVIAVVVGFLISFPVAVFAHRHRKVYGPVTSFAGVLYTIPSIALFLFLQPITGYFTVLTAEIGLVSYTLLILIRNSVAGLAGVPSDTKEAALGMGFSRRELLWRVEVPLALPVIMAGIRLAAVTIIGLVTVTALIGQGGFGQFILEGFTFFDQTKMILGGALSLVFAVVVDGLLVVSERRLTPWATRHSATAVG